MNRMFKKGLSWLLVVAMVMTMFAGMTFTASAAEATEIAFTDGAYTIAADGEYTVAGGAGGTITVSSGVKNVTITGSGVEWDKDTTSENYGKVSNAANANLHIDCTAAAGVALTLKNIYISNTDDKTNVVNFSGSGNKLIFDGTVLIDNEGSGQGTYAAIHAAKGTELTIGSTENSSTYIYKKSGGSGIGGDKNQMNGDISFDMQGGIIYKRHETGSCYWSRYRS